MDLNAIRFWYTVVTFLILFMCDGLKHTIHAPFFPVQTKHFHGSNEVFIGVCMSVTDVGDILMSLLLLKYYRKSGLHKNVVIFFNVISGASLIGFGLSDGISTVWLYELSQVFFRFVIGIAFGIEFCLGIVVLVSFSESSTTKSMLFSSVFVAFYLGVSVAPSLGNILFKMFGYQWIFVIVGGFCILSTFALLPIQPKVKQSYKELIPIPDQTSSSYSIFKNLHVLQKCYAQIAVYSSGAVIDSNFSLYLFEDFNFSLISIGWIFAVGNMISLFSSVLSIILNGKKWHQLNFASATLMHCLAFFILLASCQFRMFGFALVGFCIFSFARSMVSGTNMLCMKSCIENNLQDQFKGNALSVAASTSNILCALGRIIGFIFLGGVFVEFIGFYFVIVVTFLMCTLAGLSEVIVGVLDFFKNCKSPFKNIVFCINVDEQ